MGVTDQYACTGIPFSALKSIFITHVDQYGLGYLWTGTNPATSKRQLSLISRTLCAIESRTS